MAQIKLKSHSSPYWDTNANVLAAAVSAAAIGNLGSGAVASAGDMDLDLYGFSVGTGLKW
jgi:hypothetical protein